MNLPKIIALVGPTASGKSALGVQIAKEFDGEILCVDSRTVYRGMDVGTAKSEGWGIDLARPDEEYTVTLFQAYAKEKIADILSRGHLPVLVGGTGLWMDAVVGNLSFPDVPPNVPLRAELETHSTDELVSRLEELDPDGAEVIDRKNRRRLIRAIEVSRLTGAPHSTFQLKGSPLYDALWLGMDVPRDELDERIGRRVDEMMAKGFLEEVKVLKAHDGCEVPAMSGIGYRELCLHLDGTLSLEQAIEQIKTNTRRFARRQMTWWKRREEIVWVKSCEEALIQIETFLKQNIRA